MTQDWSVPGWAVLVAAGVLVLIIVGLALMLRSARRRVEAQLALTQQTTRTLTEQVAGLEARLHGPGDPVADGHFGGQDERADYVITRIGEGSADGDDREGDQTRRDVEARSLPRGVFADLLLRETAVRAAGVTAGLRRALAPETRNRIRFEMKQEVKRARKQRKADLRIARREWEAKQRGSGSLTSDLPQERSA